MSYYSIFGLVRDPFVNTPDPSLFFHCPKQVALLDQLEISVRLRRGLSVVIGPVGTGKTMLSRQLLQTLSADPLFDVHLLLDPFFEDEKEMMLWLNREFEIGRAQGESTPWQLKENIKNHLFDLGVNQKRIAVLLIDEGQKFTPACLEVLRELLNYETNDYKLLQIVIFAQEELKGILAGMRNLRDRVYQTLELTSFSFKETQGLINTRIALCKGEQGSEPFFSTSAIAAVHWASKGYPRQMVLLCHKAMLAALTRKDLKVDWGLVWSCTDKGASPIKRLRLDLALLFVLGLSAGYLMAEVAPVRDLVRHALEFLSAWPVTHG
jgi:general secretion pathway protein A